jgi:hypothetical protein
MSNQFTNKKTLSIERVNFFYQVLILLNGKYPVSTDDEAIINKLSKAVSYVEPVAEILTSGIVAI